MAGSLRGRQGGGDRVSEGLRQDHQVLGTRVHLGIREDALADLDEHVLGDREGGGMVAP